MTCAQFRTVAYHGCGFFLMAIFLLGCAEPVAQQPALPTAVIAAPLTATATETAVFTPTMLPPTPLPSSTAISTATASPSPTATLVPTATATSTPNPYLPYTIETLASREYGGGLLEIAETLEETETFTRYLITYPSDGLTIYGFMNVPHDGVKFPVALVLHGYIPPSDYETVAYTRRYADALAEAGYFVIHPNLRNFPPSDEGEDLFRVGLAADVLNLIAIVREQSQDPVGTLRRVNAEQMFMWGHSMGGGVALRTAVVNNAPYLRGIVLYGAMSGNEHWNYERILEWSNGRRGEFELNASEAMLAEISPIAQLDRLQTAVSIHHSDTDDIVPVEWSIDLCDRLEGLNHPVDCFIYQNQPHTFRGEVDQLFIRRTIRFFDSLR